GGNKFQFHPGSITQDRTTDREASDTLTDTDPDTVRCASTDGPEPDASNSAVEGDFDGGKPSSSGSTRDQRVDAVTSDAVVERSTGSHGQHDTPESEEDSAQASARSDVVSSEELEAARSTTTHTAGDRPDEQDRDTDASAGNSPQETPPNIEQLREELNEQFESIKILNPGQYEINLMELYDRDEYIISLREDGRYVIEVPDAWGVSDPEA
ncbi:MAG: OapC/ArvC family zinc-ribbon domain-containing protein, partial [Halobacteriota archaeon]